MHKAPKAPVKQVVSCVVLTGIVSATIVAPCAAAPKAKPQLQPGNQTYLDLSTSKRISAVRGRASGQHIADDTLVVCLNPGADKDEVSELLEEVHGTVTRTIHINNDNYDILFVKPEKGKVEQTIKAISKKGGKNFRSIDRNYTYGALQYHTEAHVEATVSQTNPSGGQSTSGPNDPEFSLQWNLSDIHWTQAQAKHKNAQRQRATITLLDTGTFTYSPGNELVNIKQYDASGDNIVPEAPNDIEGHGTNVTSIAACLTDNAQVIAGVASFRPAARVDATMLRIATPSNVTNVPVTTFVNALAWCANHQRERGGKGPISISFGGGIPPLWAQGAIQVLAHSLNRQGDHVFLGSGNDGQDLSQYPQGATTVVQATDKNDQLTSFSNTVTGRAVAPGVLIPAIWGSTPLTLVLVDGTSESTPIFAASAALLMSIEPRLSTHEATRILLRTGKETSQGKILPQLDKAIRFIRHDDD